MITHFWSNNMVTLHCSAIKINRDIPRIKPYKSDTNVKTKTLKNMCENFISYIILYYIKVWKQGI